MTHVHLIGIGGTGISSIARVLLEKGYQVSGSDRVLSSLALDLRTAGVTVFSGHAPENISGADIVVRSSAIPDNNVEVLAALAAGIPVQKRSEFLGTLLSQHKSLAVAGSHGKTTTSAMLAWSLTSLGQDPSYILGGVSNNLHNNAHAGSGQHFVIEADEYDRMFLGLNPDVILFTAIGYDHPDCFPTPADYEQAFHQFAACLKPHGLMVAPVEDSSRLKIFASAPDSHRAYTYGLSDDALYQAKDLKVNDAGGFSFRILFNGSELARADLKVPGEHNTMNALGVFAVLHQLGFSPVKIAEALSQFTGTGRRFEIVGEVSGITVVDDYAHHPAKIQATLAAARNRFPARRIVAVWQPHTYSRTRTLAEDFAASFHNADVVIVSEIYASREKPEEFSSRQVAENITYTETHFVPSLPEINAILAKKLQRGDVLIVLSAGDANQVCSEVLATLSERKTK